MKIVESFNSVRDIPYSIPLDPNVEDCCCTGKARRLKELLERNGLSVRYRVCTFRWSDLNIPQDILNLQTDDLATHVYLEVEIDTVWKNVDPTWDSSLKGVLPVAQWDGHSDTILAVKPLEVYPLEESEEIMNRCAPKAKLDSRESQVNDFDVAFNDWLEGIRMS